MKIEIKSWLTGSVLFEGDFSCLSDAITSAVKSGANLTRANLTRANLTGADLTRANLTGADLTGADLSGANLTGADLSGADITRANLTRADLSWANLTGANITRANLTGANLTGADLDAYAQVSFKGHGECGRMLTAIRQKEGDELSFYCGCFRGTEQELRKYIAEGAEEYRQTRTLALDTVLALIDVRNEGGAK